MTGQLDLIPDSAAGPEGFTYRPEFITADDEAALLEEVRRLPFKPFEFHGYVGKRLVVSFGWRYDFTRRRVQETRPIPDFLLPVRALAGIFAGVDPARLEQILVTEYQPGAGIGWHRDKKEFGDVIGVSLLGACPFRFRRKEGESWERFTQELEPRSVYLLRGPSRMVWEHGIDAAPELRYSLTFRALSPVEPPRRSL
jgi:alkylated DNA repair dioxygenase AlkB